MFSRRKQLWYCFIFGINLEIKLCSQKYWSATLTIWYVLVNPKTNCNIHVCLGFCSSSSEQPLNSWHDSEWDSYLAPRFLVWIHYCRGVTPLGWNSVSWSTLYIYICYLQGIIDCHWTGHLCRNLAHYLNISVIKLQKWEILVKLKHMLILIAQNLRPL